MGSDTLKTKTFVPAYSTNAFTYTISDRSSHLSILTVFAKPSLLAHIQDHITQTYSNYTLIPGISCKHLPLSYTRQYFSSEITRDVKQFVLNHFISEGVLDFLDKKKVVAANWPRLSSVSGSISDGLTYTFSVSKAPTLSLLNWNEQTFVAPQRKNYTDLDSQVENFIAQNTQPEGKEKRTTLSHNDWVCFSSHLKTPQSTKLIPIHKEYWLQASAPHIPAALTQAFLGKHEGEQFTAPVSLLHAQHAGNNETGYSFIITVKKIVPHEAMTEKEMSACFDVENREDLHDKLIEIFSFRNDISLRQAIIEELFYRLLSVYRFDIAPHAVTRRKESLLSSLQDNPDMLVYMKQKEFIPHVTRLAENKLKEEALIDSIAYKENITVSQEDIVHYLQIMCNDRLKDFVYFSPLDNADITVEPISHHLLSRSVRREKTLNMMIHRLAM